MPVCGKLTNFDPQNPAETKWPWLAAIYRLPVASKLGKLSVTRTMGKNTEPMEEESDMDGWQLVCSGALVNQRSVVVAAHCVTELGKLYPLDTAKIRVVLGKQYRSDLRVTKGLQRLRVSLWGTPIARSLDTPTHSLLLLQYVPHFIQNKFNKNLK